VLLLSKKGTGFTNSPLANGCASLRARLHPRPHPSEAKHAGGQSAALVGAAADVLHILKFSNLFSKAMTDKVMDKQKWEESNVCILNEVHVRHSHAGKLAHHQFKCPWASKGLDFTV
jgi:hypothetical protein